MCIFQVERQKETIIVETTDRSQKKKLGTNFVIFKQKRDII